MDAGYTPSLYNPVPRAFDNASFEAKFFDKNLIYKEKVESVKLKIFTEDFAKNNILIVVNGYVNAINFDNEDIKKIQILDSIENEP